MTENKTLYVLSHRYGEKGNFVLGVFDNEADLFRVKAAHIELWKPLPAKVEILQVQMNEYHWKREIEHEQRG